MKRCEDKIFFAMLVAIFLVGVATLVKPQQGLSELENRTLAQFPHFTLDAFLDGTYQDKLESALSDQIPASSEIRTVYNAAMASLPTFNLEDAICNNRYVNLWNSKDRDRATFDCGDYILYLPDDASAKQDLLAANIEKYNAISQQTDAYYYFVDDSSVFDFSKNQKVIDYGALLKSKLKGNYHFAELTYLDYPDFQNYFYHTDHHWDYRGSYRGYLDIAKMFNIADPVKPTGTFSSHEPMYGSHAQTTKNYNYQDDFTINLFDLPAHDSYINGRLEDYSHIDVYLNHNYEYSNLYNFYGNIYGGDCGEVIFDFHQPEKENLLIIANSYSNPINELIASHFNQTYIVDLRHYENAFHTEFNLPVYVAAHNISKTLFIMSPTFITSSESNSGLGGGHINAV